MALQVIGPIVSITAALTLKSDTQPVRVYVKKPRGTLYWGGAGLDGPYIKPQMEAFQRAGIEHITIGLTNTANKEIGDRVGPLVDAIRAGLLIRYEDDDEWVIASGMTDASPQFNLAGLGEGHFYYAHIVKDSKSRWNSLAQKLFAEGLR